MSGLVKMGLKWTELPTDLQTNFLEIIKSDDVNGLDSRAVSSLFFI
jgi:hypothetical protein